MSTGNEVVQKAGKENTTTTALQSATSTPEVSELISKLPPAPTKLGTTTESVRKTTYTETVVKRVTNNQAKPKIEVNRNFRIFYWPKMDTAIKCTSCSRPFGDQLG